MVESVQSELAAGNYVAALQDALGDTGASARMNLSASQRSVVVTGTPTGLPPAPAATPATIVSFSPEAQNILSGAQIALNLIMADRGKDGDSKDSAAAKADRQQTGQPPAQQSAGETTTQAASQVASPSVADIVKQAQAELVDPTATFYKFVEQAGGPEAFVSFMSDPQERQSFVNAFNNNTLTCQNAFDVPGLDYQDHTVITGLSERFSASENGQWIMDQDAKNGTYSTGILIPMVGAIYVTFANPSAAVSSAGSIPAAPAASA